MELFGYSVRQVNEYGLLRLREVTLVAEPTVLRDVATFLSSCADMLDRGEFNHTHLHIEEVLHNWKHRSSDVIVAYPTDSSGQES